MIVPGLILFTLWAVTAPVVVIERPRALDAFPRSVGLVRGHGWPVFGLLLMVILAVLVVAIVAALVAVALGGVEGVAGQFVQLLGTAAVIPLLPLVTTVLYFRLVEIDAERSGSYPPPSGPPVAPPGGPGEPPAA